MAHKGYHESKDLLGEKTKDYLFSDSEVEIVDLEN